MRNGRAALRRAKERLSERGPTLTETGVFTIRCEGTLQYEILDPDGRVIAWTADAYWAHVIVALLNRTETKGLWRAGSSGHTESRRMALGRKDGGGDPEGRQLPESRTRKLG